MFKKNFNKSIIFILILFLLSVGGVYASSDANETTALSAEDSVLMDNSYNADQMESSPDEDYSVNDVIVNPSFEVDKTNGWDSVDVSVVNSNFDGKNGSYFVSLTGEDSYISQKINFDTISGLSFWYMSPTTNATVSVCLDDSPVLDYTIVKTGYAKYRWEEVKLDTSTISGYHELKLLQKYGNAYVDNFQVDYNSNVLANFTIDSFLVNGDELTIVFRDKSYGLISRYYWDFGDGITSNFQNPIHAFKLSQYKITLTVSNDYSTDSYSYTLPLHAPTIERTGLEYSVIQDAIDNANNGDTIIMTPNVFVDSYFENLVIDKDLTLDFNSCNLLSKDDSVPLVMVSDGAKVTFKNISLQGNNILKSDYQSSLTIENSQIVTANITSDANILFRNNGFSNGFLSIDALCAVVEYCNFSDYAVVVNDAKSRISNNFFVGCDIAVTQNAGELNLTRNSIYGNGIGVNVSGGESNINFNEIHSNNRFGLVYSNDVIDYSNNWWGLNNPSFNCGLIVPDDYFDVLQISDASSDMDSWIVLNITKHDLDYHYWIGGVTYYNLTIDLNHNNLGENLSSSLPSKNYKFIFNDVSFDVFIENGFKNYLFTWGYLTHMDDEVIMNVKGFKKILEYGYVIDEMVVEFANEEIRIPLEVDTSAPNITYITPSTTFNNDLKVVIECDDPTSVIFYTLDGTNPCDSPTRLVYTEPFFISESTTVHATAIDFIGHYARMNYTWWGLSIDETLNQYGTKYYDYAITYFKNSDLVESEGLWNKYNDNNSISNQVGPLNNISKWSITDFVSSSSSVIDNEGHIYIGGDDGYLYCLNSQGLVIWKYGTYSKISSTPAIGSDGNIYFVNYWNSSVYCLSPNGQLLWKYFLGDYNVDSSPVFGLDGTLYILTTNENNSYLLAFKNHELLWKCTLPIISGSTPSIGSDGTIYILSETHDLIAVNWDGTIKYVFLLVSPQRSDLIGSGEIEVVDFYETHVSVTIGDDGTLYVINQPDYHYRGTKEDYWTAPFIRSYGSDGNMNWYFHRTWKEDHLHAVCYGAPTLYKDVLYINEQSNLIAVSKVNGTVLWETPLNYAPYSASSPLISANEIIYLSHGNMVYALNLSGEILWSYSIPGLYGGALSLSSPVLTDDGTLIVTTNQGIYAFNDIAAEFTYSHVDGTERTIQFTDLSTKGNNSYFWSFGDGYYSTEQNPQHMYGEPGRYRVELVVEHDGVNLARNTTIEVVSYDITPPAPVTVYINNTVTSGGVFPSTQTVTLSSSDDSDEYIIYYTVDGSNPMNSSTRRMYIEPVDIESYTVLNAVAVDLSNNYGRVTSLTFNITDAINVNDRINSTLIQKIQELLDNAEPYSKFVFDYPELYGANFTINKPLNIITNVNTRLVGNSVQPVFTINADNTTINGFTIENGADGVLINSASNAKIINSIISGDNGVAISNGENVVVKDTQIANSTNGIQVTGSRDTVIDRVSVVNSTKNGVYLKGTSGTVISNSLLENNGVDPYFSEANNILLDGNENTRIVNNTINYGYFGLYFKNTNKNTLVDNNVIYEGIGDAIYLSGRYIGLNVTHNRIEGCFMGINFNGYSEDVEVLNNLIWKIHSHEGEPESGREYDLFYNFRHTTDLYGQYDNAIQVFELASNFHGEVHIENNVCVLVEHRAWESRKTSTPIQSGCDGYGYNLMDGSDSYHWLTSGATHYQEGFVNLVLDRIGDSSYRLRLQNMRTGEFLSEIPAFDVTFTAGRYTQTVKFIDNQAVATFDVASSITTITAKISAEIKKSISWNTPIAEGYSSSNRDHDPGYEAGEAIDNPNPKAPSIADMIKRFTGSGNSNTGNGNDGNGYGTGTGNGQGSGNGHGSSGHGGSDLNGREGEVEGDVSTVQSNTGTSPSIGVEAAASGDSESVEGGSESGEVPESVNAYEVKKVINIDDSNWKFVLAVVLFSCIVLCGYAYRKRKDDDGDEI